MAAGSIVIDMLLRTGSFETDAQRAAGAVSKVTLGIAKQVDSLQRQADSYGKTAREIKLYELALDGANAGQLKAAGVALTQIEAQQKIAKGYALIQRAALAAGAAIVAGVAGFELLVRSAGNFQDLSDRTGASAEDLASLAVAAGVAGVSMDAVGSSITKLAKNLTGVDEESKGARAALKGLGLDAAALKSLDQVSQLEAIGKAFNSVEDGAEKAAYAQALFKGSGSEMLALFKELEAQGGRTKILTAEQIAQADDYADRQAKAATTLKLYAAAIASQMLPALTALTSTLSDTSKEILGVDSKSTDLAKNNGIKDFSRGAVESLAFVIDAADGVGRTFQTVGRYIGAAAAQAKALASGEFKQAAEIGKALKADIDAILGKPLFSERLQVTFKASDEAAAAKGPAPPKRALAPLANGKATGAGDDPSKRILDNALKDLERQVKGEQDLLRSRNQFLDLYNGQGLVSVASYYDARRAIDDAALTSQVAIYDKQIAALELYQSKAKKATDRATAQGRIDDITSKRDDALQKAGEDRILLGVREAAALQEVLKQYRNIDAAVLELKGDTAAAAAIRFDTGNADVLRRTQANATVDPNATAEQQAFAKRSQQALEAIAQQRALTIAQAEYNAAATESGRIQDVLSIAESRVALSAQLGAIGQLEALRLVGEARKEAIAQLEVQVRRQEALAAAPDASEAVILNAQKARLALQQLSAAADPLQDKLDGIFKGAFADNIAAVLDGTKSVKQAFTDMTQSIAKQVIQLASQDFASAIYGNKQQGTGLLGLFGSLASSFGGGATASASAGSGTGDFARSDRAAGAVDAVSTAAGAVGQGAAAASAAATTAQTAAITASTAALAAQTTALTASVAGTTAQAAQDAALTVAMAALTTASTTAAAAIAAMAAAAGAKSASSGASSISAFADMFSGYSYAVGTNYVPNDQLAMIHEGEAIVPKRYNPAAGGTEAAVSASSRVKDVQVHAPITFVVQGTPPSRETQSQLAAAAQSGLSRGTRNL